MSPRFKGAEHGDDKRVLCKGEDVPLYERLLDLIPQDQILLVDLLHGKSLTCLSVAHQVDGAGEKARQRSQKWKLKGLVVPRRGMEERQQQSETVVVHNEVYCIGRLELIKNRKDIPSAFRHEFHTVCMLHSCKAVLSDPPKPALDKLKIF